MVALVPPVPAPTTIHVGTGCRSSAIWLKIDSAMLLLPRQSVARSANVNWSRKYPPLIVRQPLGLVVHRRRVFDQVARRALRLDQRDLLGARAGRHHGHERQAEEAREVRLGDGRRAGRGLDDRRPLDDPAVAQAVQEQRAREPVLERAGRVDRLVLEVEVDVPLPRAGERRADACPPTGWRRPRCGGRPRLPTCGSRRARVRSGTSSPPQFPRLRGATGARRQRPNDTRRECHLAGDRPVPTPSSA